ncbi:MAG: purine-nucleoside phosphorylase [Desulfovibrio sp.]|uniref:purine-nucleoside phosphorylase n=1 Tax=Desulfovibrio sp. 7SRBS1 TaxID=3378064 RepID=UPI003B3BFC33
MQNLHNVNAARISIEKKIQILPDCIGVVLGTGLGSWAENLGGVSIPYAEIEGFPVSTVQSHKGELRIAEVEGRQVAVMSGRFHLYEGHTPDIAALGIRTLGALGVEKTVITNAAGALNVQFDAGGLMCITDHINFTGMSPLTGANVDGWGDRFPDMTEVWSKRLIELAMHQAQEHQMHLERGVYVQVLGPQLETPAETRMLKRLGADAVGMSTVVEAIAAHHMGMELLGISCLTNKNLPDCMAQTSLDDVISQARQSAGALATLLNSVIPQM